MRVRALVNLWQALRRMGSCNLSSSELKLSPADLQVIVNKRIALSPATGVSQLSSSSRGWPRSTSSETDYGPQSSSPASTSETSTSSQRRKLNWKRMYVELILRGMSGQEPRRVFLDFDPGGRSRETGRNLAWEKLPSKFEAQLRPLLERLLDERSFSRPSWRYKPPTSKARRASMKRGKRTSGKKNGSRTSRSAKR